jgi:6-phosphogluconolactonase
LYGLGSDGIEPCDSQTSQKHRARTAIEEESSVTIQDRGMLLYVGAFTRLPRGSGRAEGLHICRFDPESGAVHLVKTVTDVLCPAYLALHPNRRFLYSVNEVWELDGQATGGVSAFAIDQATGDLTFLNRRISGGSLPCYIRVDRSGRYVLVSNYAGGSVEMLPIQDDGSLGAPSDFIQQVGSSVNLDRQTHAYSHSINPDLNNQFALVADLGMDKIMVYRMDLERGKLVPNDPPSASARPGSGPRHLAFHPNGHWVYVIHEIDATVAFLEYEPDRGTLEERQSLSTLPEGYAGQKSCADILVHPSGRFVYGTNRGHNSIVIFAVDQTSGQLSLVGHESTQGETPRGFVLDPSGRFLLVGNQNTDTIVTFQIDQATGRLAPTGHVAQVPTPVCLRFYDAVV